MYDDAVVEGAKEAGALTVQGAGPDITVNVVPAIVQQVTFTRDQIELMKRTVAVGLTDDEFSLFLMQANRLKLDPFNRQIHAVKRWSSKAKREVMTIQVGIDGYRSIADRTKEYAPGAKPTFELKEDGALLCATACVKKWVRDQWHEVSADAYWSEYVQVDRDGDPTPFWAKMPHVMLAKVAEALALRKAFPEQLGGTYIPEEMMQADNPEGVAPGSSHAGARAQAPAGGEKPNDQDTSPLVYPKKDWRAAMAEFAVDDRGLVHASAIFDIYGPEGFGYLEWLAGKQEKSEKQEDRDRGIELSKYLVLLAQRMGEEAAMKKVSSDAATAKTTKPSARKQLVVLLKTAPDTDRVSVPITTPLKELFAEAGYASSDGEPNDFAISGLIRKYLKDEHATLASLTNKQAKVLVNYLAYIIDNGGSPAKNFGHTVLALAWDKNLSWKDACDLIAQEAVPIDLDKMCEGMGTTIENVLAILSELGWPTDSQQQVADFLKVCKEKGFALHVGEDYTRFDQDATVLAQAVAQQEWQK